MGISGGLGALNFEIVTAEVVGAARSGAYLLFTFLGGATFFFGPIIGAVLMVLAFVLLLSSVSSTAKARGTAKASKSKIAPAPTAVMDPIDLAMAPHPSICSCRLQPLACHAAHSMTPRRQSRDFETESDAHRPPFCR